MSELATVVTCDLCLALSFGSSSGFRFTLLRGYNNTMGETLNTACVDAIDSARLIIKFFYDEINKIDKVKEGLIYRGSYSSISRRKDNGLILETTTSFHSAKE